MDKPLKDWTLGEAKEFCRAKEDCSRCELACKLASGNYLCAISDEPAMWDLTDRPKYTADEIALAKLLMGAGVKTVKKSKYNYVQIETLENEIWYMPKKLFQSLEDGQTVDLKEIAESGVAP